MLSKRALNKFKVIINRKQELITVSYSILLLASLRL